MITQDEILDLIDKLGSQGINLWIENGVLKCQAEKGAVNDDLRSLIKLHQSRIIDCIRKIQEVPEVGSLKPGLDCEKNYAPLSLSQKMYWDVHMLDTVKGSRKNVCIQAVVRQKYHHKHLDEALKEIIRANSILRTVFSVNKFGDVYQKVRSEFLVTIKHEYFKGSPARFELKLRERFNRERSFKFDLSTLPLFRVYILVEKSCCFRIILTFHRIISDAVGANIFISDLVKLYESIVHGENHKYPKPIIQYSEFSCWQHNKYFNRNICIENKKVWKRLLPSPNIEWSSIPHDRDVTKNNNLEPAECISAIFFEELSAKVIRLSEEKRVTVFSVLLAAMGKFLLNHLKANNVSVYTALSERGHPYLEGMVGSFIRTVKVTIDLKDSLNYFVLLNNVSKNICLAQLHLDVDNQYINDHSNSYSSQSDKSTPITILMNEGKLEDLSDRKTGRKIYTPSFKDSGFIMTFHRDNSNIGITIDYNVGFYKRSTIVKMMDGYISCLDACISK